MHLHFEDLRARPRWYNPYPMTSRFVIGVARDGLLFLLEDFFFGIYLQYKY